ncbi:hypothetical protein GI582_22800 [Sulfitobacter sp. BDSS02]|nr:hypothetical protein [Sulfitobacter sp. BDSS02]
MFTSKLSPVWLFALLVLLGLGLAALVLPAELLTRMSHLEGAVADRFWVMRGFGLGLFALALAMVLDRRAGPAGPAAGGLVVLSLLLVATFLLFCQQMSGWWIDDSGITFSYSRSLAETGRVTFRPDAAPTEGYSSSLWMLTLALVHFLGGDIPLAAKALGTAFGALLLLTCLTLVWRQTRSALAVALTGIAVSTSPFVVWSSSGQEHALQALLLTLTVLAAATLPSWRLVVALLLSLLVLTRPETPIIVIAVFAGALWRSRVRTGLLELPANLVLTALPFAAFVALMTWRMLYFGDPMPNPYYAKASASSVSGLFNPFGGGWQYVLDGLRDSGLILLLPLAFLAAPQGDRPDRMVLLTVLAGHMFFVIWAKGDWMGEYRFLMPATGLFVLAATLSLPGTKRFPSRQGLCAVLSVILLTSTVIQLDRFRAHPTTPLAVVSEIGWNFARLSRQLYIESPVLAHHDAGGISYDRSIGLVDLGGLVDRDIAKHMQDRFFLETYIFEEKKPDYIFGAINFAAASGFTDAPAFERDYVPLSFPDLPIMESSLSHIRRDRIREAPGIRLERDTDGRVTEVIVEQLGT